MLSFDFSLDPNRDFGNTLLDCRTPVTRGNNFCSRISRRQPDLFKERRSITGICNNLNRGLATVGASETVAPRLLRKYGIS